MVFHFGGATVRRSIKKAFHLHYTFNLESVSTHVALSKWDTCPSDRVCGLVQTVLLHHFIFKNRNFNWRIDACFLCIQAVSFLFAYCSRSHINMEDTTLQSILQSVGVQSTFIDPLVEGGWTVGQLGMVAQSIDEFDNCLSDLFDSALVACITIQQKAALRRWKKCLDATVFDRPSTPSAPDDPGTAPSATAAASSWSESFAPNLTSTVVTEMKLKFKKNYPSEISAQENLPSLRLLSQTHQQKTKGDWKGMAWKFRLSSAKDEDVQSQKSARIPKDEVYPCISCCMMIHQPSKCRITQWASMHCVVCLRHGHFAWQ